VPQKHFIKKFIQSYLSIADLPKNEKIEMSKSISE